MVQVRDFLEHNRFIVESLKKRSHGHLQSFKPKITKETVMDPKKKNPKNSPEIRAYWAERKRIQRAKEPK